MKQFKQFSVILMCLLLCASLCFTAFAVDSVTTVTTGDDTEEVDDKEEATDPTEGDTNETDPTEGDLNETDPTEGDTNETDPTEGDTNEEHSGTNTDNNGGSTTVGGGTTSTKPGTPKTFSDVDKDAYYAAAVAWAVEKGIISGTSETRFSPNAPCTRCQALTCLWKAMGSPEPSNTSCKFKDVPENAYYYKAVLWAVEMGITSGIGNAAFAPDSSVTRSQLVTFLWRAAGSASASIASHFADVNANAYYFNAVQWAAENHITSGTSATTFSPVNISTRAQYITFLFQDFAA